MNKGSQSPDRAKRSRLKALPSSWKIEKLRGVADVIGGSTPSTSEDSYWDGEIRWATPTDITGLSGRKISRTADTLTREGMESCSAHRIPAGSVLMTSRATIGECAVNTVPVTTNQGFQNLVPRDRVTVWYLLYRIEQDAPYLESLGAGSTFSEISKSVVEKVEIPLPPLWEQRKIASVLYTVDQAIQKTEDIIEQTERVKRGVLQNILARGTCRARLAARNERVPQWNEGTLPDDWEIQSLSEICSVQTGYAFKSEWYKEEGVTRVLRGKNVGYGSPDWEETRYISEERAKQYESYRLEVGNLIIGMDRPFTQLGFKLSKVCEDDLPALLVQRVGRFKKISVVRGYLHALLDDWRYQKQLIRRSQGMDIPHISKTDILAPKVPIPPKNTQKEIAEAYNDFRKSHQTQHSILDSLRDLRKGLMQDLLTGEVRTADKAIEVLDEVKAHG